MTARDLISGSFRLLGVLSGNEAPTANEATNALSALNDMVDAWATQKLMLFATVQETFALIPNQQVYQMGAGAPDFNTVRPQKIENVIWQQPGGSATTNLPIAIINQDQWAAIKVPNATSNLPTKMFPNMTNPYATLYFWPIPLIANNVIFWSFKPLTSFATLDTVVALPPGYSKLLKYNLAVELAPEYGKTLDPIIIGQAVDMKGDIKRINNKTILLSQDAGVLPRKRYFNYISGD